MPNNGIISDYANLPEKFKVASTSGFNTATDTIVINQALDAGSKVAQKAVTLDQLGDLVGGSLPYKEVFLRTNYVSSIQYGYSSLTSNTLTIAQNAPGDYILNIQNPADRPANIYKIEVNADCVGGYGIENDIWRIAVDASFASAGQIRFYTYKYNTTTNVFQAAVPLSTWHPVHIRIYS